MANYVLIPGRENLLWVILVTILQKLHPNMQHITAILGNTSLCIFAEELFDTDSIIFTYGKNEIAHIFDVPCEIRMQRTKEELKQYDDRVTNLARFISVLRTDSKKGISIHNAMGNYYGYVVEALNEYEQRHFVKWANQKNKRREDLITVLKHISSIRKGVSVATFTHIYNHAQPSMMETYKGYPVAAYVNQAMQTIITPLPVKEINSQPTLAPSFEKI